MGWIKTTQTLPTEGKTVEVWHVNRIVLAVWNGLIWCDLSGNQLDVVYWRKRSDL